MFRGIGGRDVCYGAFVVGEGVGGGLEDGVCVSGRLDSELGV